MTRMIIDVMLLVPFILIQTIVIVISSAWTLAFVLGFAISCLKLLLVTHFHLVHPLDPEQLGRQVFFVALALATIPNSIIGFYLTAHGIEAAKIVQLASKGLHAPGHIIPYIYFYAAFWAVLGIIMLGISAAYIPYKLRNNSINNDSIRVGEVGSVQQGPNLVKLLLVFTIFVLCIIALLAFNLGGSDETTTLYPFYLLTLVPTMVLLWYTLDTSIGKYVLRKICEKRIYCTSRVSPLAMHQLQKT